MRLQEQIDIPDIGVVTINEMTVGEVKTLLHKFTSQDTKAEWHRLFTHELDEIINHFSDTIVLPNDKTYEDLTWSNVQKIWATFTKLNPFFQPITNVLKTMTSLSPEQLKQLITMPSF
jgi:hypothetical protein